jgi:DNA-binding IclR family transcriptional regulator
LTCGRHPRGCPKQLKTNPGGDHDGRPFSVAKIAAYMRVPRTTVMRRLERLQSRGVINRQGSHYHLHEKTLNSLMGMRATSRCDTF